MSITWCPRLQLLLEQSCSESKINSNTITKEYALYPNSWIQSINNMTKNKYYSFNFIGGLHTDDKTYTNRNWLLPYIKNNSLNKNSYIAFTDKKSKQIHKKMGDFDYTHTIQGFVPKMNTTHLYFDNHYFSIMCQSKFTLCPAGDSPWSMRFYESILCHSIPIVQYKSHSYRNAIEQKIPYYFYTIDDNCIEYNSSKAKKNYELFIKYHTRKYMGK